MATAAEFRVVLTIDSQGNAKIEEVKKALGDVGQTAQQANQGGAAAADEFAGALMRQLGIYALVTAGLYKLEQAAVGAFKAGIQAVDDYKLTTIGVAATLTDMAQDQSQGQMNYALALGYSKDMYSELELAAARYFASGKEMTQAWNILAQKGIVLRKDEIDSLGVIVDRIKLSTQGQVQGIQIAQEMRALLTGQARVTDQIGMLLKDRIPNLEAEIAKHRQIGDLVKWLGDQFKGLAYASQDIQGTLESQKSTLDTLITQVGRGGLEGAYTDIVGILVQINDYLLKHKDEIGVGIARGWLAVKELTEGVRGFVSEVADVANKGIVIPVTFSFGGLSKWLARDSNIQALAEGAFGGVPMAPDQASPGRRLTTPRETEINRLAAGGAQIVQTPEGPIYMYGHAEATPAPTKAGTGKEKKGGGRDTTDTLENLIMQLRQEQAKLTEGAFAGIDAWYAKITEKIKKLAMDDRQLKDGMLAATELKSGKEHKVVEDFTKYYDGQMHRTTAAQMDEDLKRLANVKGNLDLEAKARDIMYQHALDRSQKLALAELQQQKGYYDSLAGASILIQDQITWKEKAWQIEKKISQEQLEQWFKGKDITENQKEEYRSLLALTNQAKEYNFARQKAVELGTLEGWAIERAGEALKRDRSSIKDMLSGAESFFTDAWNQGIQGALSQTNKSWKDVGKTIVQSMVLEMNKKSWTKIWDEAAKLLAPKTPSTLGPGNVGALGSPTGFSAITLAQATKLLDQAGQGNVKAAEELNLAAGAHKDAAGTLTGAGGGLGLSGAQLGLSAGGLLLSGIGIATNSQALITAGMVLQVGGTMLQTVAMLMMFVAAKQSIPIIGHTGLDLPRYHLGSDEFPAVLQRGEWVLNRDAVSVLRDTYGPGAFKMFNSGRVPAVPVPVSSGSPGGGNQAVFNFGDLHLHAYDMTPQEAEKFVDRKLMPAIEKRMGDRGLSLID